MSSWIKIYNSLPTNPKHLAANAGQRCTPSWLFVCGCCYSNEHLTDGFIPTYALNALAPGTTHVEQALTRLVAESLWHVVEGGWRIHDYGDVQRSAAEIKERRESDAARKAVSRASNGRMSARSPRGHLSDSDTESGTESRSESEVLEVELRVEVEKDLRPSCAGGSRAASRAVDQTVLPEPFPEPLIPVAAAVLSMLAAVQGERGGDMPTLRGVGLAMRRFPARDHIGVAHELEHWALAGRGQRQKVADWCRTFATFLQKAPDGAPSRPASGNVVPLSPHVQRANAWQNAPEYGGRAS